MPGGCAGKTSCDAYCADSAHIDECMTFALAAGLISGEEAEIVRKTGGQGPGGCKGKAECDAYCGNQDNMKTCIGFGLEYGLMPPEEAEQARKMLVALDKGVKMPACQKDQCDAYCSEPEHKQECMDFALAAGFITEEDAAKMNSGEGQAVIGPGGCKSEQECHEYCSQPEHAGECGGGQNGEMQNPQGSENSQPISGPGGCQSEAECHEYCSNPEHASECGGGQNNEMLDNQQGLENPDGQNHNPQGQENPADTGTANPDGSSETSAPNEPANETVENTESNQ